ncbi:antirepressor AbbA [Priestia koreensis]|uniref:Recombinase XerD n=1 Tax=Priestia koreensis TaxID=284581 RepID=A0A0M0LI45_9BACI|nr:antirepressor AbbA [Priestia koreensis]KOO50567.1 recombinase XerD [Priestia koreensis]MCM3003139.1 antirepressor AbbA [Priestia koreensis]UNL85946.1 antirepressor AbbA [Priestia koreensis]
MSVKNVVTLTQEEAQLLLNVLFEQQYAVEIVSSHINDIEQGLKRVDQLQYQKIASLYNRLCDM